MNNLIQHIEQAEEKWLNPLYNFCQDIFSNKQIPSHDHTHHLRVWKNAKEIFYALSDQFEIDYPKIEACLIASLFHDTGLTKTISEKHGKESKTICIQYFENNNLIKPGNWEEILFAVENHDDKDYKLKNTAPESLLSIICNADDLDAFGYIGVIRYTEIYLLRGHNLNDLPKLVLQNIDQRFLNFETIYQEFSSLYHRHKEQYLITKRFFENLKKELI